MGTFFLHFNQIIWISLNFLFNSTLLPQNNHCFVFHLDLLDAAFIYGYIHIGQKNLLLYLIGYIAYLRLYNCAFLFI